MKKYVFLLLFAVTLYNYNCQYSQNQSIKEYPNQGRVDNNDNEQSNFHENIYKDNWIFKFKFSYFDSLGNQFFFTPKEDSDIFKAWDYSPKRKDNIVTNFQFHVKSNSESSFEQDTEHYQTTIRYVYLDQDGDFYADENTGLIENKKKIWMHPPRFQFFQLLELNPFPFIMHPFEVGNSWSWALEIGDFWSDKRWKEWSGSIVNDYKYEITKKDVFETPLGQLECLEIIADASSVLGISKLRSLFNKRYGFVRLEYTNINNSMLIIELNEVLSPD